MERAFIYITLTKSETFLPYQPAITGQVKTNFPEATVLDLDAGSDQLLFGYAAKLIAGAEKCIVFFRAEEGAVLSKAAALLEELIRSEKPVLVGLQGRNQMLQKVLQNRPALSFLQGDTEAEIYPEIDRFFKAEPDLQ